MIDATGIDVAIAGDRCALTLYSLDGITRVLMPLGKFLIGARGPRDCNGHDIPSSVESAEATLRVLERDAAALPVRQLAPSAPSPLNDGDHAPRAVRKRLQFGHDHEVFVQAWTKWSADPRLSLARVGLPLGISGERLRAWFVRYHGEEYALLMKNRYGAPGAGDDNAALALPAGVTVEPLPSRDGPEKRESALRAAWELFISTPALTLFALAHHLQVRAPWLRYRFEDFAAEPGAPVLKPDGKL